MASLILTTRGASETTKGTIKDISNIIETVQETAFDAKKNISTLLPYMDCNDCSTAIYFETSKRCQRLWIASEKTTIRFSLGAVESVYDISNTNNYHKHAGHSLYFSSDFDQDENLKLTKELLTTIFEVKSDKPCERILSFFIMDKVIYMRNYLIDGLAEVGPRLEMSVDKIIDGCFKGKTIYNANPIE
jgi:rRNA maturation protein Rpf1